jgi:glutamate-1-semialdehyde 2,1-aminomutase
LLVSAFPTLSSKLSESSKLSGLMAEERRRFLQDHPRSRALSEAAADVWRGGVPMHWMGDWASPSPVFVSHGRGAEVFGVDGHAYADFCLGDTPAMFGHADEALADALYAQARRGLGFMLPTKASIAVGRELAARFGLPLWQAATTATDANRAAIRWARAVTGRERILVFDGCYHGAVEDTFLTLASGAAAMKPGLIGQVQDVTAVAEVTPFNDLAALEAALAGGAVAAVLAEPVLTNCGMILPDEGFHARLRSLTRAAGTLLILDETHTLSSGPGGYTAAHGLEPDMLTVGKAIAGGVPAAVWGMTAELAARMDAAEQRIGPGSSGIGTTLAGNALAMAAMETMLCKVMTRDAYGRMAAGAARLTAALEAVVRSRRLPWSVVAVGARVELVFADPAPRNAQQMRAALDPELAAALHLWLMNRGVLIAPFHNMMLVSPTTTDAQIDQLAAAVASFADRLEGAA